MRNLNRFRIVTSALLLIGLLDGCAAERKCGFDSCTDDQKITAAVRTIFDQHPDLGPPAAIQVQTQNHIVYLNGLVGEGLGAAVGAVCARAGCASASANHKAILWITSRSAVSTRLDWQNCNRESVRVNRARAPNENTSAQGTPLRAASFQARQPAISSLVGKRPVAFFE